MNVAGICLFEPPSDDDGFFDDFIHQAKTLPPTFPFNQVLHKHFFWQDVQRFAIDEHFFCNALPDNAGIDELLRYLSIEHSKPFDKTKPLWQCHLITNIAPKDDQSPKRFAIYLKLHHALTDGVAAMRLWQRSLSDSPQDIPTPFWAVQRQKHKTYRTSKPAASSLSHNVTSVSKELWQRFIDRQKPDFVSTLDTPKSILNQRIDSSRHIATCTLAKSDIDAIAKKMSLPTLSITTNDVILALCAGALRRYLAQNNALPSHSLTAFVPISLRQDESSFGNQLSFLLATLGTHLSNPTERLHTIAKSIKDGKARFSRMNQAQVIAYSLAVYGAFGVNLATKLLPSTQAFNLIISNIPANNHDLFLGKAKLTAMYPASVLLDGQALNITFANYHNKVDIGILACKNVLPNIDHLRDYLLEEVQLLLNQTSQPTNSVI